MRIIVSQWFEVLLQIQVQPLSLLYCNHLVFNKFQMYYVSGGASNDLKSKVRLTNEKVLELIEFDHLVNGRIFRLATCFCWNASILRAGKLR